MQERKPSAMKGAGFTGTDGGGIYCTQTYCGEHSDRDDNRSFENRIKSIRYMLFIINKYRKCVLRNVHETRLIHLS
jgi:hypothetical protein